MADRRPGSPIDTVLKDLFDLFLRTKSECERSLSETSTPPKHLFGRRVRMILRADLGGVILSGDTAVEYSNLLLTLHEAIQSKQHEVSIAEVETAMQEALLTVLDQNNSSALKDVSERTRSALLALRAKLQRSHVAWKVELEVGGLASQGLPFTFGQLEFYVPDSSRVAHIRKRYKLMVESTKNTLDEKAQCVEFFDNSINTQMIGRTYAHLNVSAVDKNAAETVARRRLRQTLDVLNFFGGLTGQSSSCLFLPGEAQPCSTLSVILPDDEDSPYHIPQSRCGPLGPFSFAAITPEIAERCGLHLVSSILEKQNRSSLDDRILTAMQWAGRASVEKRIEESFLLFAVSLESLLLTNKEIEQITYRFSVRGAHLLGSDLDRKRRIYRELKSIYRLRSTVVHSGKIEVSEVNRDLVGQYARAAILSVLLREDFRNMTTSDELDIWFEDQVLGQIRDQ